MPLLLALFIVTLCLPNCAQARPQVLTIIADNLTLIDTLRPQYPALTRLHNQGETALMSPGLARGSDPVATVYATLGAGDAISLGGKSQGLLARTLANSGLRAAQIGTADSDDTGFNRPAALILPTGAAPSAPDGTTFDPLAPGGRRTDPAQMWNLAQLALAHNSLVIVHDGDFARAERARLSLLPRVYLQSRARALQSLDALLARAMAFADTHLECTLLLVVPTAPLHNHAWDSLTPLFVYKHSPPLSPLLQTDTTQTPGLVAARDFAPAVLALLHVPPPIQMTGAPFAPAPPLGADSALLSLRQLDTVTRLNQQAQNPVFWTAGLMGAIVVLSGLALVFHQKYAARQAALRWAVRYGVRVLASLPLALLLAPLLPAPTLAAYCAVMGALVLLLGLLPSPSVILNISAVLLVGDAVTGTRLASQSLLSVYALSGIRFYGIGNEYMGVLLAGTLTLAGGAFFAVRRRWGIAMLFVIVLVALSFPSFGAKAGGAVTACATFWAAWLALNGHRVRARAVLLGVVFGFGVALFWGMVGHWLPVRRTHLETATTALGQARFGYIAGVAARKVGLAVYVLLHPGTLAGLLGLGLAALLARRVPAQRFDELRARLPQFAALWQAGVWGSVVCVLFNDSGIVAAILLATSLALVGLHGLLTDARREVETT